MRELTFKEAILEGTSQSMAKDNLVYVMGLGVPDSGAIFGTTRGLQEKFGAQRVMDMPTAENAMTGIAIGAALAGMRPIMIYQRVDFMLLAVEQLVNQAAKWHYMSDGQMHVPLVLRAIIGRGWGQGAQHMQSLHSWFAHIPGLKVVMPFSPADAKGLLISAIEDNNPVVFLEHRWLHNIKGPVPEQYYTTPLGIARVVREGRDVTVLSVSHMTYEALQAAELLAGMDISAEVVDIRSLRPLDTETILASVRRTGRVVVADPDWGCCGFSAELLALVAENAFDSLKAAPLRVVLPDYPLPVSPALSQEYYPQPAHIAAAVFRLMGLPVPDDIFEACSAVPHDIPDVSFTGPF